MAERIVEAYVGEYASGKSEVAVNRALDLARLNHKVNLVDFDIVEPCYTLRPIKKQLSEQGIDVIAWDTRDTLGLGEAGNIIKPASRWVLLREGDVVLDIGYGVEGSKTLNLLEGADKEPNLKIYMVVNISRPITSNVKEIVEYARELSPLHGLINNTHLGDETTPEVVQRGARVVTEAAKELGLPIIATTAARDVAEMMGDKDCMGNVVRPLDRYMPHTLW